MPIYEYLCRDCKEVTEAIVKIDSTEVIKCSSCESLNTDKIISLCGWDLKGDGWYNPNMPLKRARGGSGKPTKP